MVLLLFHFLDEKLRKHKPNNLKCKSIQIRDNVCSLSTEGEIMFYPKINHIHLVKQNSVRATTKIFFH